MAKADELVKELDEVMRRALGRCEHCSERPGECDECKRDRAQYEILTGKLAGLCYVARLDN